MQNHTKNKKTRDQTEIQNKEYFDYNINIPYPRNVVIYNKFIYQEHTLKF